MARESRTSRGGVRAGSRKAAPKRAASRRTSRSAVAETPYHHGALNEALLKAAETVLAAADRYHASAVATKAHVGEQWGPVGKKLHERLFEVQLARLKAFAAANDWDGAAASLRATLRDQLADLKGKSREALITERYEKFRRMGAFEEASVPGVAR